MATAIQRRRGNTAQHASFTGLAGEITIDTDKNTVVVHDGVTAGGYPLARADEVEALGGADITAVIAGSGLTGGASSGNATISLNYENLAGNLVPSANNTYSLGTIDKVWKDVFVGPGSLYVNGQQVLSDNSGTITVSADTGQNLSLVTTGGGDLELNSNSGEIQLKSNVTLSAGKTITASGGLKLSSNLDVNSQYINNLTNPVQAQDAATKSYVDSATYLSAGDGLSKSTGTFSVDSTVVRTSGTQTIGGAKTFSSDLVVSGNLTVSGTTTTVNSETISLADNLIDLNSNFTTGSPTENAGIRIKRGDSADVQVRWNETDDKWQFTNDGSTYVDMLTATQVKALFSATDTGGDGSFSYSDGVFTYTGPSASEVRAHFSAGTGVTLSSGQISIGQDVGTTSNVTFNTVTANVTGTVSSLGNHDTGDLAEGTNLYFTAARVRGNVSATDAGGLGSFSYDNGTGVFTYTGPSDSDIRSLFSANDAGGDGSFSYSDGVFTYTGPSASEVRAHFSAGTGVTLSSGQISIGQDVGTTDSVTFDTVTADLTGNVTGNLTGDVTGNVTGTVSSLANHDTADLTEGTNLYFTAARARGNISVTDNGGDGSLSYDNSTGVISYTGPSASEVRAHFSAGTGVTLSSGQISIGQAVGTTDNVTFGDLTVSGNLTVSGSTTTVNTETINLADNKIVLNSNYTGSSPSEDGGIEVERGTEANKTLLWNETDDKWTVGSETFVAGTFEGNLTGDVTGTVSSLSNHDTTDLAEGTNLYYTAARANSAMDAYLVGGNGLTYSSGTFAVGSGYGISVNADNIALSNADVRALFSVTDSGGDGSFSYNSSTGAFTYTGPSQSEANARIDAYLTGGTGVTVSSGQISIGQAVATTSNVTFNTVTASLVGNVTGNVTGAVTGTVSSLSNHDTADLAEGTNLYFTAARARGNISVTDSGGDGSLSYNSSTGVITYTGPSATEVRAHFSAGTGVTLSSGQISIGQAVGITDNVTFNNVTASANFIGNLTGNVTGTVSGNAGTATKLATARTISLAGDVTGSVSFDGSANAEITATIAANSVALGTDTTGNYVASIANGNYITGGGAGSEGAALTLAVDATTTATASKVAARDSSGDLYANIFQGTATSARYADLAERYEADAILEPGTVVCFGGEKEITACDHENDHAVAGVVSTDPAYMMNSAAGNNDTHPYIALTGRVPVKVVGPVAKGDLLVASGVKGHAMANNNAKAGTIIGKAIGSSDSGEGVVEALINLM